ncbi:hypothetical protein I79_021412 [Cricetulus griseus]|uniref:Uncharacterized protein n=1 Tax=Cricetulus griseus TaxID=10029 RepID=G3ICL4_CRIGR|nr:hypothetical protein I79_021412 [Cricetulus griseus]
MVTADGRNIYKSLPKASPGPSQVTNRSDTHHYRDLIQGCNLEGTFPSFHCGSWRTSLTCSWTPATHSMVLSAGPWSTRPSLSFPGRPYLSTQNSEITQRQGLNQEAPVLASAVWVRGSSLLITR